MTISCTEIRKRYGGLVALDCVSLSVAGGQILGLAGPNGAGKTTLLDVLSGRVRPDSGQVTIGGNVATRLPPFRRARLGLARTFQSPLVPETLTVGDVLEAARFARHPHPDRARARGVRELVGLDVADDVRAASLDALSRRKLLLACLFLREPTALLLDEPASGLLQEEIDELDSVVRRLTEELQVAVIVVEHRLEFLFALADRAAVLDEGRLIAEGTPAAVFDHPVVKAAYFEAPAAA